MERQPLTRSTAQIKTTAEQSFFGPRQEKGGSSSPTRVIVTRRLVLSPDGSQVVENEPKSISVEFLSGTVGPWTPAQARHMARALLDAANVVDPEEPVWTFFGHWEDGEIVLDVCVPGEHEDDREQDDERWPEGLWCDSGRGSDPEAVFADLAERYESEARGDDDEEEKG